VPFRAEIAASVAQKLGMDASAVEALIETPPQPEYGDYALPCFSFAKALRKSPAAIAEELVKSPLPAVVSQAVVKGGYANFFVDKELFADRVLTDILTQGTGYGSKNVGHGRTVCVDYSSINIAKPFHIGHLSSTAIGHALYNLYNFMGYKSVGINHLGDWGTQFGKLLAAYELWGEGIDIETDGVNAMLSLYVRFHEEAEKDPALEELARRWFKRIEDGDEAALILFTLFKDVTIREVMGIYELLGIKFDSYAGESFYNDKMQPVVDELRDKGLLEFSDGAYIVDLSDADMPPCIILRSDGATLYATRDLAAVFYRKATYDFAKCLYVVAYQQNLHFRQLFKVVEKMGYEWATDLEHVNFGMVSLADGGTLSTRRGNVVRLEDVLDSAVAQAREIMEEKSPDLPDKDEVAKQVGIGAVVFGVLYNARIKDIAFSFERVLSFDGETAPYLQYTHARCHSVKKKAGETAATPDFAALCDPFAFEVLRALSRTPQTMLQAMEKNEPYLIARNLIDIAQAYNRYYYEVRILDDDAPKSAARLALTTAVGTVIKGGLQLLGIAAPERM
jgi:arginyl-tRNA synthetase